MIFTYWQGNPADVAPFLAAWRPFDRDATAYGDDEVRPILSGMDPSYDALFGRIRIAACKSDIARLALLHRHGGLYMDAHGAPEHTAALTTFLAGLSAWELVLFDEPLNYAGSDDIHILTGALAGRQGSRIIRGLLDGIFQNLARHAALEADPAMRPRYNIFVLSGPWELRVRLITLRKPYMVKPEFAGRVERRVLPLDVAQRPFL